MQVELPQRGQIIRAVRKLRPPINNSQSFQRETVTATDDFDYCANIASCAISALFTEDADQRFRFTVVLDTSGKSSADFSLDVDADSYWGRLTIYRLPAQLLSAPADLRLPIFLYLVAFAYIAEMLRLAPEHDWGIPHPDERLMLDLLSVDSAALAAARRSIWH